MDGRAAAYGSWPCFFNYQAVSIYRMTFISDRSAITAELHSESRSRQTGCKPKPAQKTRITLNLSKLVSKRILKTEFLFLYVMGNSVLNIQLKEGNPGAFQEFFKVTYPRLIGYCKLFVKNNAQAEDLVQECFLKFWEKRANIQPHQSAESLIFVMLRNRCLNHLRDQKLIEVNVEDLSFGNNELQHLFQLDFLEKEEKTIEEELIESMKIAIDNLPEKRKIVFTRAKLEGLKNQEVAKELGISVKAVEKHLHEAKEQLRREMLSKFPMLSALILILLK